MVTTPPYLSLIIPCFNEEMRLAEGLKTILSYLKSQKYPWELIIVDDGSTDKTGELVRKLIKSAPSARLITHQTNKGKGAAIRTGILKSSGNYVVFCDIDMSTPISEIAKVLTELKTHEVVIGVRRHKNSHVLKHQPWLRENLGQVFTKLTNFIVTPGIVDVTCGFKGFQRDAAMNLFKSAKINRWAFDAEILFLAIKWKYRIAQIPIIWKNDPATRVSLVRDGINSFIELLKIRFGAYANN